MCIPENQLFSQNQGAQKTIYCKLDGLKVSGSFHSNHSFPRLKVKIQSVLVILIYSDIFPKY